MGRKPIPSPGFLDRCEYLGYIYEERRWRSRRDNLLYTWDSLHGEVEVYNSRGEHRGVLDAVTGEEIKPARRGRTIRV
ncbi:MAG: colicin E3/pyocin S6 family cytotoxin [Rhodopila sp.]